MEINRGERVLLSSCDPCSDPARALSRAIEKRVDDVMLQSWSSSCTASEPYTSCTLINLGEWKKWLEKRHQM